MSDAIIGSTSIFEHMSQDQLEWSLGHLIALSGGYANHYDMRTRPSDGSEDGMFRCSVGEAGLSALGLDAHMDSPEEAIENLKGLSDYARDQAIGELQDGFRDHAVDQLSEEGGDLLLRRGVKAFTGVGAAVEGASSGANVARDCTPFFGGDQLRVLDFNAEESAASFNRQIAGVAEELGVEGFEVTEELFSGDRDHLANLMLQQSARIESEFTRAAYAPDIQDVMERFAFDRPATAPDLQYQMQPYDFTEADANGVRTPEWAEEMSERLNWVEQQSMRSGIVNMGGDGQLVEGEYGRWETTEETRAFLDDMIADRAAQIAEERSWNPIERAYDDVRTEYRDPDFVRMPVRDVEKAFPEIVQDALASEDITDSQRGLLEYLSEQEHMRVSQTFSDISLALSEQNDMPMNETLSIPMSPDAIGDPMAQVEGILCSMDEVAQGESRYGFRNYERLLEDGAASAGQDICAAPEDARESNQDTAPEVPASVHTPVPAYEPVPVYEPVPAYEDDNAVGL